MDTEQPIVSSDGKSCSDEARNAFVSFVARGGEVSEGFIRRGVERAPHLLWIADDQGLIGTAALKIPNASHWEGEFRKANCGLDYRSFPLEFGYLFVDPAFGGRGYGSRLLETAIALAKGTGLFATVRTDNERMKSMLVKRDFVAVGKPYVSERGDYSLALFVRHAATVVV